MEETFEDITPDVYGTIARDIFGKPNRNTNLNKALDDEICSSLIGASYIVCAELWRMIQPHTKAYLHQSHPKHLLWALLFLKVYSTLPVLSRLVGGVSDAEFSEWSWLFVTEIAGLKERVIVWTNRFRPDRFGRPWNGQSQAVTSVDTTDCAHKEMYPFNTKAFSHKFNGPGWRYEVVVAILSADIVWINGPFEGGRNDVTIFKEDGLLASLAHDECVECDGGYEGNWKLKNPTMADTRQERDQKDAVRARHEIVNSRLKQFEVLNGVFRHTGDDAKEKHGLCFAACAVVTQLTFEFVGHLHHVEYDVVYRH